MAKIETLNELIEKNKPISLVPGGIVPYGEKLHISISELIKGRAEAKKIFVDYFNEK